MKYLYAILTMASLSFVTYNLPTKEAEQNIQYYDMSEYQITILPRRKK